MNTPTAAHTSLPTLYTRAQVVQQALELLECEAREADALASPDAVRDYLRLLLADRPHEVFAVVFLDAQNRVIVTLEMFRGTLTQTSVYPREVLIEALARSAASDGQSAKGSSCDRSNRSGSSWAAKLSSRARRVAKGSGRRSSGPSRNRS